MSLSFPFFVSGGFRVCHDCAVLELRGDAFCSADWFKGGKIRSSKYVLIASLRLNTFLYMFCLYGSGQKKCDIGSSQILKQVS